ncbi:MAG: segregation and condensation protein A [Alphaproteobacteria bacterium]
MTDELNDSIQFEAASHIRPEEALIVELDGFEGPLDLLLNLARDQKVDLAKISVLKLADQYLAFVEKVRAHRLELAADYLVMAAWLTYLKSRLLFEEPEKDGEPGADALAAALRWRLQRLQVMRESATRLMARDRLGRDVFPRGNPEPVVVVTQRTQTDTLYDFFTAYAQHRLKRTAQKMYELARQPFFLIEEARERIERVLGKIPDWNALTLFLPPEWKHGQRRRSALASTFMACLEMTRDGRLLIRQLKPFGEIFLKDREQQPEGSAT